MARIRSVRPEFWEHEGIGTLSRDARLLYIASWNLADDEGLLRWTATYLKSSVFMYDDDISIADVERMMSELQSYVFAYRGGTAQQRLGWIINFRKHQKVNRPQPSKLSPPSLQNLAIRRAYADRDGWTCHLCGGEIRQTETGAAVELSMDHVIPRAHGGSDYPSNIAVAHLACNQSKRDGSVQPRQVEAIRQYTSLQSRTDSGDDAVSDSVNDSRTDSPPEGEGEGEGKGKEMEGRGNTRGVTPPPGSRPRCTRHAHLPADDPGPNCVGCRDARLAAERDAKPQLASVPDWCGECSDHNRRQVELEDGRLARCPRCHPLRSAS